MKILRRAEMWYAAVGVGAIMAFAPMHAFALSSYNAVTITKLLMNQGGRGGSPGALIFFTPTTPADTEGCTTSGSGYAWIDWSSTVQPDGKAVYATVLAASMAGKKVNISVSGCANSGYYPFVSQITVIM
ncbi:MAG: hypothetical protein JSR36_07505 [Proteobacteria bacterium]|nr:hypothetical protein [Pseudomonadota bacterium]